MKVIANPEPRLDAMKKPIRSVVETITPERALALLKHVKNVRNSVRPHILVLAAAMRERRWEMNGSSIKLDHEGYVVDGEHRLRACVEAGVPFTTLVVYGIEKCATMDTCSRIRTAGQVIGGVNGEGGIKNATIVAAIAKISILYETDGNLQRVGAGADRSGLTVQVIVAHVRGRESEFAAAAASVTQAVSATRLPSGALGFVAFHAATNQKLPSFLEGLATGEGLRRGDPAYALRERAISVGRNARINYSDGCAMVFKAWNAHAAGARIYKLMIGKNELVQTPVE